MENYELYISNTPLPRNPITGRFNKGSKPHNKGKKWSEYMSKRGQKKALKNLKVGRETKHINGGGHNRKTVVVFENDVQVKSFASIGRCSKYLQSSASLVSRALQKGKKCKGRKIVFDKDL